MEENERIVLTAPLSKYEDDEVVNTFLKCVRGSPRGCGTTQTLDGIVLFSQPQLQEQPFTHMIHDGSSRDRPNARSS
jgi:inhibitor of KinA sporulation pathway (predicted exonuclease)